MTENNKATVERIVGFAVSAVIGAAAGTAAGVASSVQSHNGSPSAQTAPDTDVLAERIGHIAASLSKIEATQSQQNELFVKAISENSRLVGELTGEIRDVRGRMNIIEAWHQTRIDEIRALDERLDRLEVRP